MLWKNPHNKAAASPLLISRVTTRMWSILHCRVSTQICSVLFCRVNHNCGVLFCVTEWPSNWGKCCVMLESDQPFVECAVLFFTVKCIVLQSDHPTGEWVVFLLQSDNPAVDCAVLFCRVTTLLWSMLCCWVTNHLLSMLCCVEEWPTNCGLWCFVLQGDYPNVECVALCCRVTNNLWSVLFCFS